MVGLFTCGCHHAGSIDEAVSTISREELTEMAEAFSMHTGSLDKLPESEAYWTDGGTVYHTNRDCGHLSRAKVVTSGTIEEALNAGKAKICSTCSKNDAKETEATDTTTESETESADIATEPSTTAVSEEGDGTTPDSECENTGTQDGIGSTEPDTPATAPDGTVYWTKSGSVYHSHEDCSYLLKSKNILSGTVEEAQAARKPRLCSTCAKADSADE